MMFVIILTMVLFYIIMDRDEKRETEKMKEREEKDFARFCDMMKAEGV